MAVNIVIVNVDIDPAVTTSTRGDPALNAPRATAARDTLSLAPVGRLVCQPAVVLKRRLDLDVDRHYAVRNNK